MALAAALAAAFFFLPKHAPVPPAPAVAQLAAPPALVPTAAPSVVAHPTVDRPAPRLPAPTEEFLRLDDEPIETATIVRVGTDSGLQADLIVGPDGRAHAIRVVRHR
jgi:hypothetical protein